MQHNFSQLHNNVMERNVVRAYSLQKLPQHAQRFGLAPSKCSVSYNPDCILKQIKKKSERENAALLNLEKPKE